MDELPTGERFPDLRADFTRHLSICRDEEFLHLVFAQNALQLGQETTARLVFRDGFPRQFLGANKADVKRVNEWELETIVNEFLSTSTSYRYVYADHPRLNHRSSLAIVHIANLLRQLENEECAYYDHGIRYELRRIINRQFEWQRGFFNKTLAYRTAIMYGGPECERYLKSSLGVTLDDISYGAFALFAAFQNFLQVDRRLPTSHLGLSDEVRNVVFDLFSAPLTDARTEARRQRHGYRTTAYRPSILRKFPCIRRSDNDRIIVSPLPQLIMARATSGIFYDVISGGGAVRNEVGRRFEQYCLTLLRRCFPDVSVEPEFSYRAPHKQDSPDILLSQRAKITGIYECKAVRMSFADRFAESEFIGRGYDEIAKAVMQIWRFVSHCRRGLTGRTVEPEALGMVVLLDSWMTMVLNARQEVISRAEQLVAHDPDIRAEDRVPILFTEIGDLETLVLTVSFSTYVDILRKALTVEFDGWLFSSILNDEDSEKDQRPFPFDDLSDVVPWWGRVSRMTGSRERAV